jgi:hypothetical protein
MFREIKKIVILLLFFTTFEIFSQVENLTVNHPVYSFLFQIENKGILENKTLADLPLSIAEIKEMLKIASYNKETL